MTRTFLILPLLLPLATAAQQPLVLLDPARGGADSGTRIAGRLPEKQVTLDLAGRLASLLRARGFAVQMTREADVDMTGNARAALANNTHPIACILLYAASSGSGVHLYTSALRQKDASGAAVRWDEAQAPFADRSRMLAADLRTAMDHGRVTASVGQTWLRPLDNMQCPAVAVELLPEKNGTGAEDSGYQSHVANAVANTLLQWRNKVAATMPPVPQPAASPVQKIAPQQEEPGDHAPATRPDPAAPVSTSPANPATEKPSTPSAVRPTSSPASPAVAKPPAAPSVAPGVPASSTLSRPSAASTGAPGAVDSAPRRAPAVPRATPSAPIVRQAPAQPAPTQPDRTEP